MNSRMSKIILLILHLIMMGFLVQGQATNQEEFFVLKGAVVEQKSYAPISGVSVMTDSGGYTTTNSLGEFSIRARKGDMLIVESPDFETVRHRITSDEDIRIEVQDFEGKIENSRTSRDASHLQLIDSANYFKKDNIERSIDFIAQSIAALGKNPNKRLLSQSLFALGEIYLHHQQYDLAIANFEDALNSNKTIPAQLGLGEALLLNKELQKADNVLKELEAVRGMVPYQRIKLYELLGDAKMGLGDKNLALEYYEEGLRIAKKNQVTPKVTDLTSKIGATYASSNRQIEAQGYFDSSLELSKKENPKRAIQESEKVADFYSNNNRFNDEIRQRRNSLNELQKLKSNTVSKESSNALVPDSISSQRINYKIGNAFAAQNKLDEAIPYLQRSIVEADSEEDLTVQKDATRKLSEVYKYKGDFTKAFETYQEYVTLVDTLYARKEQEISRAIRQNREIVAKQNRISSLEQDRELSQSKYDLALTEQQLFEESNKRQKLIIYSLLFGLILAALTAILYYRSNKQQQLANNLLALKSLRSQMNPHFIFNALNSVNNYIATNDERSANRFLSEFSVLMRTVLENSEEDFIPLSKELELLKLYVKLEHSRFSDKFDYEIEVDEGIAVDSFEIPPMLLQPYIENAIWHGLRYKEKKGFLKIKISPVNAEMLKIEVSDNGIGRKKSAELKTKNQKQQRSKGMGNIKKRVAILNSMYQNKVDVTISDLYEDETGTKVKLILKKD